MDFTYERAKLHCHTEQSLRDSAEKIPTLVKRAKEMGVPALALTNHGIMTGMYEFVKECNNNDIKPIPGVEGYYSDNDDIVQDTHICLYPEDYDAYSYIGMAVTSAGKRLHNGKPVFDTKILRKYFGESSPVHGKVMMTSACVGGVFAKQMLANEKVSAEIDNVDKKIVKAGVNFDADKYQKLKKQIKDIDNSTSELRTRKGELEKLVKKTYTKEKNKIERLKKKNSDGEEYKRELEIYQSLVNKQAEAKKEYVIIEDKLKKLKAERSDISKDFNNLKKKKDKIDNHLADKANIQSKNLSEADMYNLMRQKAEIMIEIFGKDNVFCEIQYHYLEKEKDIFPFVVKLADEYGLKLCTANDAHFAINSRDSVRARQMMLSLRFNRYVQEEIDHKEYYLKSDKELYDTLINIYSDDIIKRAFDGVEEIGNRCNFSYPNKKHYPKYEGNAKENLRAMAYAGISKRYPNNWDKEKEERLEYELSVIDKLDVNDYHCITADNIRVGKELAKQHETGLGYGVGPGRGSAAGSVVCYLTGITNIDPFQYGLLFERYLNEDRVTMPDIDVDYSEEVREQVIEDRKRKYGKDAICSIITEDTMAARASIRNAAKFLGMEQGDPKLYSDVADLMAKTVPSEPDITLTKCIDTGLFNDLSEDEEKILHMAKLIEGTISGYGSHAAGIIIGDGGKISRHIPLKRIPATKDKPEVWVCQCDMVQAEELNLLKMDFLGLKTLDVITKTVRTVKKNKGITIDIDNIPFESEIFKKVYSMGDTLAVFQVEGAGMRSMLKRLKPDNIEDVIMAISIYRPGPMQYMDKLIARKNGKEPITYLCEELRPILQNTYGCIVYQEQVMQIFQSLAGYSLSGADTIRRYMSKKKTAKLEKERKVFINGNAKKGIKGCVNNGISEEIATQLFDEMTDFAKYAFNKSHAAAYALVSYQTAYLKYYYPVEFYAAVLSVIDKEKKPAIIHEIKEKGLKLVSPDINESGTDFTTDGETITFGLNAVEGMGKKANLIVSRRGFRYNSFKDFLLRGHEDTTSTYALIYAGAFDTFTTNRKALEMATDTLLGVSKKIKAQREKLLLIEKEYMEDVENVDKKKKYQNSLNALNILENHFRSLNIDTNIYEDELEKLNKEFKALGGVYLTGHPLNSYNKPLNCSYIESVYNEGHSGFIHLYGSVKNLEIKRRKRDGKEMAFFELEDTTGTINVACFTNEYEKLSEMLKEDAVLKVAGKVIIEYRDEPEDAGENTYVTAEYQLILRECEVLQPVLPTVILNIPNMIFYMDNIMDKMEQYHSSNGRGKNLLIHDRMTGEFREYKYPVTSEITELCDTVRNISFMDM